MCSVNARRGTQSLIDVRADHASILCGFVFVCAARRVFVCKCNPLITIHNRCNVISSCMFVLHSTQKNKHNKCTVRSGAKRLIGFSECGSIKSN